MDDVGEEDADDDADDNDGDKHEDDDDKNGDDDDDDEERSTLEDLSRAPKNGPHFPCRILQPSLVMNI